MNKIWLVARREYWFNLRRRSFLFAVFGVPLFTFVVWFVVFAVISGNENDLSKFGKVGYVDQSGVLANPIIPTDTPDLYMAYADEPTARKALDDSAIGAYFKLPQDYMKSGKVEIYSYNSIPSILNDDINSFLLANLSRQLQSASLDRIENPVTLNIHINDSGRDLTEANFPALFFIPLIFAMLFIMSSGTTSGFLMNGIVEEKTNRIMEVLITSLTPMQMLLGKIIGLGALGLTQLIVWGVAGGLLIRFGQAAPLLNGLSFPTDLMIVFVVYFILSYFLLASLMAGLGAIAGSEQESRQYSGVISLLFVIPFFFIETFITDPNGSLPVALTLIPFTAPMTALLRLGLAAVPAWQIIASLIILLFTSAVIVWSSARVFRWGLLLYGKRPTPRELWHVIRSSPRTATVAAHADEKGV
jgi:ABC-2 type transport system permease protein